MTLLLLLLIPIIFIVFLFTMFMAGLTYSAFVWKDKGLVIMCAIFWAAYVFGICIVLIRGII